MLSLSREEFVDNFVEAPAKPNHMEETSGSTGQGRREQGPRLRPDRSCEGRGHSRPSREPRAVHAPCRGQRLRGRHGGDGAQHSARHRGEGISPRSPRGDLVLHRRLRRHQGAHQLSGRQALRRLWPQDRPRCRLAHRSPRSFPSHVGPVMEVGAAGQRVYGREPGAHVVHDGHHRCSTETCRRSARPGSSTT